MTRHDPYVQPQHVTDLGNCYFYHTMELPGGVCIPGHWDLRNGIRRYLGETAFAGKRVLDVGSATGCLSFYMEQQGAEVVSYDLGPDDRWDVVPFAGTDVPQVGNGIRDELRKLRNSYWYCHRAFRSRNRAVYGTVYGIPPEIGAVDIATCGSILLHLRDPFLALQNVCQLTRETIIIADMVPRRLFGLWALGRCLGSGVTRLFGSTFRFMPDARKGGPNNGWWYMSPQAVRDVIAVLGFEDSHVVYHSQPFMGSRRLLYTVVGHRTKPAARLAA
jgi:SAM-dependent methyltransferase